MPGESISIPILTPGADAAARNIKQVGNAAAGTAGKLDVAAASLALWNDTALKSAKADATAVASRKAHAKADALLADAENVLAGKATTTTRLFADQQKKLDDSGKSAAGAASRFSALAGAGGGGGGMGALIGAGVALSPVLVTVGFGLAGLAAAAYGVAKPIENAAQKTGGLSKNLALLGPEQQQVARGLLALGKQYAIFQNNLKPEILGLFNQGISIAGNLLHDVQPVAAATGKALSGVLASIDQEFQSGTWQRFFGFMAQNAGPDVQLLGKDLTDLLQVLPPLLQDLQPLGRTVLLAGDDAARAAGGIVKFYDAFQRDVPISNQHTLSFLQRLDKWTVNFTNHWVPGARAINASGTSLQHTLTGTAAAAQHIVDPAKAAATELQAMATATANLMTAQSNAVAAQTAYGSAILTSANDAAALEKALDASHGKVGLLSGAQRASFGAANTYISDLANQATQAYKSGHGTDAAIGAISKGLPILESAKTRNKQYWQEVQTLVGWLDRLRQEKAIHETVFVSGSGVFTVRAGSKLGLPGGTAGGPFGAKGVYVTQGTTPTADNVVAHVSKGELIVPTSMVNSGAVDHLRGKIPGFASGGLVGGYSGNVAGLVPWSKGDLNATVRIFEQATAAATLAAMKAAARAAAAASSGGHAGPGGGAPSANAALAHRLYASQLTPASWAAWNYVAMRESGWSQFARNPSSGAYGIAQALPPTKYPFAGQAAGGSNPMAQISWMWNYMAGRYGGPLGAEAHERAFNWYDRGGLLPPGLSLAYNGTGRPEMVLPNRGTGGAVRVQLEWADGNASDALLQWIQKNVRIRGGGDVQKAFGRP